ncbi:MAG: TraR/DksA C4-type zinc finger protein [Candidatus Portnoybacteria bacterium]|nr:TraR/DksA C4-type zinc finger protein [Candidatus Portnoybacteria bacterium]
MDEKTLAQLKKALEERKRKAEKELESIAKKDPKMKGDYDARFPDFGLSQSTDEDALEVQAYENNLSVEYALEIRLQKINQALEKMTNGTYGICDKCGQPIDERRLLAMPETTTCTKCQKKAKS